MACDGYPLCAVVHAHVIFVLPVVADMGAVVAVGGDALIVLCDDAGAHESMQARMRLP